MTDIARDYVQLVLALGLHDKDYVDAYYGPADWRAAAEKSAWTLAEIGRRGADLRKSLAAIPGPERPGAPTTEKPAASTPDAELDRLRRDYLDRQLSSLLVRVRMLGGERLTFDEESRGLYDAAAPVLPDSHFEKLTAELARRFPGTGPLVDRYEAFRKQFVIPRDRLEKVFGAAIDECRARTTKNIQLPSDERFTVEYVTGKSWSAYNWYKGEFTSVIQVNTDLPVYIDRALDLACHEGYPGHHVYNVLLEKHLVRDRGWVEFSVYPLFSPSRSSRKARRTSGSTSRSPAASASPSSGIDSIRSRGSTHRKRRRTTKRRSSPSGCRMPATRRRGATSTASSPARRPPRGSRSTRS